MYQRIFGTISLPLVFPMIRWRAASMDLAMDVPLEPLIVPMTVWGLGLCNTVMFPVYSWSFAMNQRKIIWFHGVSCRHALVLQVPWLWEGGPRSILPRTWCSITIWAARQEISGLTCGWNHLKAIESSMVRTLGPKVCTKDRGPWANTCWNAATRLAGRSISFCRAQRREAQVQPGNPMDHVYIRRHYAKGCYGLKKGIPANALQIGEWRTLRPDFAWPFVQLVLCWSYSSGLPDDRNERAPGPGAYDVHEKPGSLLHLALAE